MSNRDFLHQLREPGAAVYGERSRWLRFQFDPLLSLLVMAVMGVGLMVLYSADDSGHAQLRRQGMYMIVGLVIMLVTAQFSPRLLERWAWWPYGLAVLLLLAVDLIGSDAKGARRWLALGPVRFQPAELMKLALPMVLSAYLAARPLPPRLRHLGVILAVMAVPLVLVVLQPDLGTAVLIGSGGAFVLFLAGLGLRYVLLASLGALVAAPIMWLFVLHEYQKTRVLTLLDPESDKLGAGWNIIQSTTAIGSGGWFGKGWMQGTQSQLDFLPEGHTDFIIAVLAEEFGLVAVLGLLSLYLLIILRGLAISRDASSPFAQMLSGSIVLTFFVYVFVNMGMVAGLLPVVGVPLPMVSYGGTSVVTLSIGFGILMAIRSETGRRG